MTYSEQANQFKASGLSLFDVCVADAVENVLEVEPGENNFEKACNLVTEAELKMDAGDCYDVCEGIKGWMEENNKSISEAVVELDRWEVVRLASQYI
jgi:hypothetical protein